MGKSVWDTPSKPCPYCGSECEADWVDIGVGMQQCGPYYCAKRQTVALASTVR